MATIGELQDRCLEQSDKAGFTKVQATVGDLLMLMVTEIGEALEEYRNGHDPGEVYVENGKPEGVPIELADVVIRVMDFCGRFGINLEGAIIQKLDYNQTREYMHGGKRF